MGVFENVILIRTLPIALVYKNHEKDIRATFIHHMLFNPQQEETLRVAAFLMP